MKIFTRIENQLAAGITAFESVDLSYDDRKRGRLILTCRSGKTAGIQITRGQVLRHGTWLTNDNDEWLQVNAADEAVSTANVSDPTLFARACYHLGNRHVSLQIGTGFLRYQKDYVLDDMLRGLGIEVVHTPAVFEPESGAYAKGHSHSHTDDHEHRHGQSTGHHHGHDGD
ncbi:urease accessory protein UreE [Parahalioglobus pacificus]|uniref:Urease accessory protein UreE n=1 Tax=Parahalioglobus pacificus TaxID=930806 RepID=A0A918XC12_9GAMM|nr:urease accessory protein UreE [Halioglobus pacificus]NQY02110.1 urease accessory protein UreE [Halieaceae bacterium]GHD25595.1 urease accessory protein UreE [Halioglobus pacificus]